jgi:hypothetical protein
MRPWASAAVVVGLAGVAAAFPPGVRAVRLSAPSGGDGLSWGTAYNDLQVALDAARVDPSVTELWIAAGTYYPPGDPSVATFRAEHVSLYGGFNGTESAREQRAPSVNIVTLSGDLDRNGQHSSGLDAAPVLTVVAPTPVQVDGLRIVDGYAWHSVPGAAIDAQGSIVFRGCVIRGDGGSFSRVMRLLSGGSPVAFIACDLAGESYFGATIESTGGVQFSACTIDVYGSHRGDALLGTGGATFDGCTVIARGDDLPGIHYDTVAASGTRFVLGNWQGSSQGAWGGGSADLDRCVIGYTSAGNGIDLTGTLRMRDCFIGAPGSGQTNIWASRVEADNCRIVGGNTWASYIRFSSGWVRNCTITGFYTSFRPSIELLTADATISNSILLRSSNFGTAITMPAGVTGLVNNSCVRGWDPALGGEGNFDADPLLDSAGRLMAGSPCIDAGSNALVGAGVTHDFEGRCRVVDGDGNGAAVVDIGASEYTTCAADCDCATGGPLLTVGDLMCFMNRFGAGDPWANCDGSTGAPVLNVLDFNCYLNRVAAGCP